MMLYWRDKEKHFSLNVTLVECSLLFQIILLVMLVTPVQILTSYTPYKMNTAKYYEWFYIKVKNKVSAYCFSASFVFFNSWSKLEKDWKGSKPSFKPCHVSVSEFRNPSLNSIFTLCTRKQAKSQKPMLILSSRTISDSPLFRQQTKIVKDENKDSYFL